MLPMLVIWILLSAALVAGGWILSALHAVTPAGYAGLGLLCLAAGWFFGWRGSAGARWRRELRRDFRWGKLRRRFLRPLPCAFAVLAALAIGGGFLYAPNNYDGLTYRIPRMLNWAAEGHWHWIHTACPRLNNRAQGFEWLTMPLLIFTGSDRAFFLPNALSFLLLPGLLFRLFTRLGMRSRVAWHWMWILPSGYSLVLQAGGGSNDLFAVPYVLAALDFAFRARDTQKVGWAWLSILAAALMTGAKGTNITLLLPWAVALIPVWRLLLKRLAPLTAVAVVAALVSFLPTAALNVKYCGDWSGAKLEVAIPTPPPLFGVVGNAMLIVEQNFAPPIFPMAQWWSQNLPRLLPAGLGAAFDRSFEREWPKLGEIPIEDTAPLGFGVCALAALSVVCAWRQRRSTAMPAAPRAAIQPLAYRRLLLGVPYISLLAYMVKVGVAGVGRVLMPYYPLLLPVWFCSPAHEALVRKRWWRRTAIAVMGVAIGVVIVNPARPLWPAQAVLARLSALRPNSRLLARARTVYQVYGSRADALGPIRDLVPPGAQRVGFVSTGDEPEASLWRPFGSRRVFQVLPTDTAADLRRWQLEYVIVSPHALPLNVHLTLGEWLEKYQAEVVGEVTFAHSASNPARAWYLARLKPLPHATP